LGKALLRQQISFREQTRLVIYQGNVRYKADNSKSDVVKMQKQKMKRVENESYQHGPREAEGYLFPGGLII